MQQKIADPRIAGKFGGDRAWSLVAVIVLWLLYAFVFYEVRDNAGSPEVLWALAISGGLVILFNTAAIWAMIAHLSEERDEIYGLDLHYLDTIKNQ
jgi:ABC-type polysaccharide/polyol phosphate export permease